VGKPVAGEVVVIPFPQTDLKAGKRRPALVLVDLPGEDVILCQITSRARSDESAVALDAADFERGKLHQASFIRPQRLFTVEQNVILYSVGKAKAAKLTEVLRKVQTLFATAA
jgi:mRNA-degrading endonuclease toxin of MazEF toxin-antitoxin module